MPQAVNTPPLASNLFIDNLPTHLSEIPTTRDLTANSQAFEGNSCIPMLQGDKALLRPLATNVLTNRRGRCTQTEGIDDDSGSPSGQETRSGD